MFRFHLFVLDSVFCWRIYTIPLVHILFVLHWLGQCSSPFFVHQIYINMHLVSQSTGWLCTFKVDRWENGFIYLKISNRNEINSITIAKFTQFLWIWTENNLLNLRCSFRAQSLSTQRHSTVTVDIYASRSALREKKNKLTTAEFWYAKNFGIRYICSVFQKTQDCSLKPALTCMPWKNHKNQLTLLNCLVLLTIIDLICSVQLQSFL